MPRFTWGKHNGLDYSDPAVSDDYFQWLIDMRQKDIREYQAELDRREAQESASQSMHEQIIKEGYRSLAKKLHPDVGGDKAKFQELQGSYEVLQGIMKEVREVQK